MFPCFLLAFFLLCIFLLFFVFFIVSFFQFLLTCVLTLSPFLFFEVKHWKIGSSCAVGSASIGMVWETELERKLDAQENQNQRIVKDWSMKEMTGIIDEQVRE